MGIECNYSFADLYRAAFGIGLNIKEKRKFQAYSQEQINALVIEWAKIAGWKTKKKKGADKKVYLSFYPVFK